MADKRLFEQPLEVPAYQGLESRLAYGKSGVATKNITFNQLISLLNSALSFLRPSSNLNDLQNKATARNNLDVYSKSETYNKSEVDYQINSINNKFAGVEIVECGLCTYDGTNYGYVSFSYNIPITFERLDVGKYKITHNLNSWSHQIIAQIDNSADSQIGNTTTKIGQISRFANYDIIYTSDDSSRNDLLANMNIFIMLLKF